MCSSGDSRYASARHDSVTVYPIFYRGGNIYMGVCVYRTHPARKAYVRGTCGACTRHVRCVYAARVACVCSTYGVHTQRAALKDGLSGFGWFVCVCSCHCVCFLRYWEEPGAFSSVTWPNVAETNQIVLRWYHDNSY